MSKKKSTKLGASLLRAADELVAHKAVENQGFSCKAPWSHSVGGTCKYYP